MNTPYHSDSDDLSLGVDAIALTDTDSLPPLEIQPPPGFLRFFPPLIKQMAEKGVQFKMEQDGALYVEGFYKNGSMKLDFDNDTLIAIDKRQRVTRIETFEDIIQLNFAWWKASNTKSNYVVPERPWLDEFISNKWVKRKIIFEPIDETEATENE